MREGASAEKAADTVVESPVSDRAKYPIDLPSPVLLAGSVLIAIISVGSLYQGSLALPTVVGVPLCIYLFYASIQKGIAETEADDELYLQNKDFF